MPINESFIQELSMDAPRTRKILERLPEDKLDWKPHDKSMPLGRLATHIAELPGWGKLTLEQDVLDMGENFTPTVYDSVAAILEAHDKNAAEFREVLARTSEVEFMKTWTMKYKGQDVFSAPKIGVVRDFIFNHIVHHRGQLTVYLRLNDVPLPMIIGPSADEAGGF